jgi:hypothetical protein
MNVRDLDDLAKDVRWVSDLDGDGYGYDVKLFETDGQQRLLEVKTTSGNERTPFWMTRRECDVAAEEIAGEHRNGRPKVPSRLESGSAPFLVAVQSLYLEFRWRRYNPPAHRLYVDRPLPYRVDETWSRTN